jgi:hypothetical protein
LGKLWEGCQSIERTSQTFQALRKRREFRQSQHAEINFAVDTDTNAFKSDFHGWRGFGSDLFPRRVSLQFFYQK